MLALGISAASSYGWGVLGRVKCPEEAILVQGFAFAQLLPRLSLLLSIRPGQRLGFVLRQEIDLVQDPGEVPEEPEEPRRVISLVFFCSYVGCAVCVQHFIHAGSVEGH